MAENLKELWPGWETLEEIGEGSFGRVYKISRKIQGSTEYAALKVLSIPKSRSEIQQLRTDGYSDRSISAEFSERLNRIHGEYAMLAQMKTCANVVSCEDLRTIQQSNGFGWDIYIKMELLVPLKKAIAASISEKQVIKLGMDMCNALRYCEGLGVVHRDIKPENIFVTGDGSLYKLGDFGIARTMAHTTMATKAGTYEYMAPEVYNNQPYGSAADLYSLGLVLYWMLNDRALPFWPRGVERVPLNQREQARIRRFGGQAIPAPAHGCRELQRIVLKACAFRPADRYASAMEMYRDLEQLNYQLHAAANGFDPKTQPRNGPAVTSGGTSTIPVSPPPPPPPPQNPFRPYIIPLIAVAIALLVVIAVCGLTSPSPDPTGSGSSAAVTADESCRHQWQAADCTTAQTCSKCGQTQGAPLGHIWQLATASSPKTCTRCGATDGSTLSMTGIRIRSLPQKTAYYVWDALEPQGLAVDAVYSDGHTEALSLTECGITPQKFTSASQTAVTVSYAGFSDSFAVTLKAHVSEKLTGMTATATSELDDGFAMGYHPSYLFDGTLRYAYVEGVPGVGIGEEIRITLHGTYYISSIVWYPGYQHTQDRIEKNGYPTSLTFYFDDGSSAVSTVSGAVYVGTSVLLELSEPVKTTSIRVVIENATIGLQCDDTCIAEMELYGWPAQ